MSRYFVILGAMRTGSNLLETTLAQYPDLVTYGEAFNPAFPGKPRAPDLLGWSVSARDADPLGFLAVLRAAAPGRIPGFRLFDGHDPAVLAHVLADPDCARIVLTRDPLESWVSLRLAQATDQWLLKNPVRRVDAKVRFDAAAFEEFREERRAFYDGLRHAMQVAGQTAFEVDYAELKSRAVIDGIARHCGAEALPPRIEERIARQNPGPVEAKLENPEDLAAWRGAAPATDRVSRAPAPALAAPAQAVLTRHAPLVYLPVPGAGELATLIALERIDAQAEDAKPGPAGTLRDRVQAGETLRTGLAAADLRAAVRAGAHAFAFVRHPAERLYALFTEQAFPGPQSVNWIKHSLGERFGPLPALRKAAQGEVPGHDTARQRALFAGFLDLVEAARAGTGPDHPDWAPQAHILRGWSALLPVAQVARFERFEAGMRAAVAASGGQPPSEKYFATLAAFARPAGFPAEEVLDAPLRQRAAALCRDDVEAFGY